MIKFSEILATYATLKSEGKQSNVCMYMYLLTNIQTHIPEIPAIRRVKTNMGQVFANKVSKTMSLDFRLKFSTSMMSEYPVDFMNTSNIKGGPWYLSPDKAIFIGAVIGKAMSVLFLFMIDEKFAVELTGRIVTFLDTDLHSREF